MLNNFVFNTTFIALEANFATASAYICWWLENPALCRKSHENSRFTIPSAYLHSNLHKTVSGRRLNLTTSPSTIRSPCNPANVFELIGLIHKHINYYIYPPQKGSINKNVLKFSYQMILKRKFLCGRAIRRG